MQAEARNRALPTPLVSTSLPEDHRDPPFWHMPLPWRDTPGFSPHAWTSKHTPHALKGCWKRHREANTSSSETRASVPCFWPWPQSPLKTSCGPVMQ